METSIALKIYDEIKKRPEHTTYIVSGEAYHGAYTFHLTRVKSGMRFITGLNDTSSKRKEHVVELDTINKITAIDWDKEIHDEVKTVIYKR